MEVVELINRIIGITFAVCYAYQFFYILVSLFGRSRPHKETKPHKIAILISARNEELVIGHLLDSIKKQTYNAELLTTIVIADNCIVKNSVIASGSEIRSDITDFVLGADKIFFKDKVEV